MRLGVLFIALRDLGVVGAPFGRPWLPSVCGCIGLSDAHRTVRCTPDTALCNDYKSSDWLVSCSGGIGPSGAPCDHCPLADVATSRWLAGTPDCPALHTDGLMNYSQCRLKFPRAGSWSNRAPDCLVGGTGPSGAIQWSPFFSSLFRSPFAPFGLSS
jgi:hypothetical protein